MTNRTDPAEAQRNKTNFLALLEQSGITQANAAELIAAHTMRNCSVRAVRSWLTDETVDSYRPCPAWAVAALEARLKKLKII